IRDSGGGISETLRDHMFEPFISSKHTVGVGMGLTIARHALRNLGGEVNLHSVKTGGTSAVIVHPVEVKPTKSTKS
ncbi:MAG: HAMP domain-containing histidine kinase, partial [Opitutaceae bacterium]|nr:HAMP domain-containing histidine kinase [Opitutaceae bacterium]